MSSALPFRRSAKVATVVCGLLLAAFATLAYSAATAKTATIDEPTHLLSGTLALRDGDYRMEVANPALWKMGAAAADAGLPVRPADGGPLAKPVDFAPNGEALWAVRTLFATPGNDGERLVHRGRLPLLLVGVALGAAAAGWAYRLAGAVAAIVAVALFAFDPTMLAHAPLIKSDLALGLTYLGLGWLTWHVGRRATVARVLGLGLVCGLAVNVKFSGLLNGPVLAALLLLRAIGPTPWPAFGRVAASRPARVAVAAGTCVVVAAVCVTFTWGCYRFRYASSPVPGVGIDMPAVFAEVHRNAASAALGRLATPAEVAAYPVEALNRFVAWADARRLLPQAYLAGLAYQSANVLNWPAYLNGVVYFDGRAAYFPLAWLYKTPLPEIAAVAAAAVVGCFAVRSAKGHGWAVACVALPAAVFGVAALRTHLNIGLRTALPFYAYADVAIGVVAAWAWQRRPRLTAAVAAPLLLATAAVAVSAWPDYLAFFNAAVGGPRQGLAHLADSNLDWGQDARGLADWQRANGGVPIYTELFVSVDPSVFGADVRPLWLPDGRGGRRLNRPPPGSLIAVSGTFLAGLYADPAQRAYLARVAARPPVDDVHGSIYLFRPPADGGIGDPPVPSPP